MAHGCRALATKDVWLPGRGMSGMQPGRGVSGMHSNVTQLGLRREQHCIALLTAQLQSEADQQRVRGHTVRRAAIMGHTTW